jgi:drug/metabolite transporter (DMT)-like permease
MESRRATLIGASAIGMWSTLALLTGICRGIPPFQLTAMAFSISGSLALLAGLRQPPAARFALSPAVWALGIYGLFGYHLLYFIALGHAPVVEASLLAYLWPLLIVLLSALLPGERLRWYHVIGGLLGFAGAAVLITGGGSFAPELRYAGGYAAALACAFTWSSYSVLSRRFGAVPTAAVGRFCAVTALLAWPCHFALESFVAPSGAQWLAAFALGIGPVGLAFFAWDYGVKRGNIRALGILSYAAPLLSTLFLCAAGQAELSAGLAVGCVLILGGAVLGASRK